jgi:prepilin-type N-terminal cleavage/methylation domain-containing protein
MRLASSKGFTLIELLVVLAIMGMLMAILMPMYSVIQNSLMRSRTGFVISKVDAALRKFKTDYGVYPYQAIYPDLDGGESISDRPNNLIFRLGTAMDATRRTKIVSDMRTAATQFNYSVSPGSLWDDGAIGAPGLTYVKADFAANPAFVASNSNAAYGADMLNRMARERMRLAVLAGAVAIGGPVVCKSQTTVYANRTTIPVLPSPAQDLTSSTGNVPRLGWTSEYLSDELEHRFIDGDAVLDAWRRPLVYICQALPAIGAGANINAVQFGMGAQGFDPRTGPAPAIIASNRPTLLGYGRIRLSRTDAGDGQPTPTDATWFPDAANLMHTDRRYYAPPGFATEFELWSAGRDGRFSYMRDDAANRDNVSVTPYDKGLLND